MSNTDKLKSLIGSLEHRSELLPLMFNIKGKPYSLDDYPPFKALYETKAPKDILYMCGRQIGKTTNLSKSEVLNCVQIPHFQILYVAPLWSQTQRYSTMHLRPSIRESKIAVSMQNKGNNNKYNSEIIKTVSHQSFRNGSGVQLTYAKTDTDRARGISADRIDFDEIQDQLIDGLGVITQSLTNSDYQLVRYTGTAKTIDNTIEGLWQDSTQTEWTMKCPHCNHWNQPTLENNVFDMIQLKGLCCSKCGKVIDPRNGDWLDTYPYDFPRIKGYHIPQIIIPAIVEDERKWNKVVRDVLTKSKSIILQEVLGISADQGARLLTKEAIDNASILPIDASPEDPISYLQSKKSKYKYRIVGIDWGIAEESSFTVAAVIGVTADGHIDVLNAIRFTGGNPILIMKEIHKLYKTYSCNMVAADAGAGFVYNAMLGMNMGLPLVSIQYSAQNSFMTYNPQFGRERWVVDKVSAITLTFLGIITGKIRFPKGLFMSAFIDDLLSPFEYLSTSANGHKVKKILRNPSKPDDFTHALTFANLAANKLVLGTDLTAMPSSAVTTEPVDYSQIMSVDDYWD